MNFEKIVSDRRAVNFFDPDKPIKLELVKKMIELASKTPSSFNLQPWNLIILTDKDEKLRLQKCAMNQSKISDAPVTMIVLADNDGFKEGHKTVERVFQENIKADMMTEEQRDWFKNARNNLYGKSELITRAFSCKNTGFFAMSLMLAAKSLGIESHPMDGFNHDKVVEEFKIPDNYYIPLLISFGYFDGAKTLPEPKWRKGYDDIVVSFDN
ncbi:MAG: nitroreductase family protein [Desulfobacteraceae bacterium]|nr:nitroreductase family protein [Desulfobacteraceae bacterium]